ncbi:MAG: protein kinase [Candidatus Riflebacteria bacterium]|nr:protein kinase [Candidatus Riflebacteria bacterium]
MTMPAGYRERFEIVREIGKGGMGVVYLARQSSTDRLVAVKVLSARSRAVEMSLRRFKREAHLVQKLSHPNVVSLLDFDVTVEEPYLVFEYVDGAVTLTRYIHDQTARPPELATRLSIGVQIASGMSHLHEKGIIHRDLKPGNVLMDSAGHAWIIDLGLSRAVDPEHSVLTRRGQVIGTCVYMAPEQILGEEASLRSDVYALGLVLYELALGRLVFSSASARQITPQHRLSEGGIAPLGGQDGAIPAELSSLVQRCLSVLPDARPADAGQVHGELAMIASQLRAPRPQSRPGDRSEGGIGPGAPAEPGDVEARGAAAAPHPPGTPAGRSSRPGPGAAGAAGEPTPTAALQPPAAGPARPSSSGLSGSGLRQRRSGQIRPVARASSTSQTARTRIPTWAWAVTLTLILALTAVLLSR